MNMDPSGLALTLQNPCLANPLACLICLLFPASCGTPPGSGGGGKCNSGDGGDSPPPQGDTPPPGGDEPEDDPTPPATVGGRKGRAVGTGSDDGDPRKRIPPKRKRSSGDNRPRRDSEPALTDLYEELMRRLKAKPSRDQISELRSAYNRRGRDGAWDYIRGQTTPIDH